MRGPVNLTRCQNGYESVIVLKVLGTYVTLFIHKEEAVIIFSQEIKRRLDVVLHLGDLCDVVLFVVIANHGRYVYIGVIIIFVSNNVAATAPTLVIAAVDSAIRKIGFTGFRELTSKAHK